MYFFRLLAAQIAVTYGLLLFQTMVLAGNTKYFGDSTLVGSTQLNSNIYLAKILLIVGVLMGAVVWLGYIAYKRRWLWLVGLIVTGELVVVVGTLSMLANAAHAVSAVITGVVLASAVVVAGVLAMRPAATTRRK
ncbi:hypothetical protein IPG36_04490 [bacterium]|nr:MAG: hypothetical protein IPG36_04490 [bacterium]